MLKEELLQHNLPKDVFPNVEKMKKIAKFAASDVAASTPIGFIK